MSSSQSLGGLAVDAGLLSEEDRQRLATYVADRARGPRPVSFGQLLLEGGLSGSRLCDLLAGGAHYASVACDACEATVAQARLTSRDEYPCPTCGALLFGFLPFSAAPAPSPLPSPPLGLDQTAEFGQVLPLPGVTLHRPGPAPAQHTEAFQGILPTPGRTAQPAFVVSDAHQARSEEDARSEVLRLQVGLPESLPFNASATQSIYALGAPAPRPKATEIPYPTVGGYRLLRSLGEGGMGQVFLAEDAAGDQVALKLVLPGTSDRNHNVKRFKWEAEALERMHHPNVVEFVTSGFDEERKAHYLALEFVPGGTLAEALERTPQMEEARALRIARGVCLALAAAAERGIVHRDVKPGNILLDARGEPKLADLGLSKDLEGSVRLTATGMVMGTPAYMAPEQALSERLLDVRTDLYALGGCLFEMLTGKVPFVKPGRGLLEIVRMRLKEDLESVRSDRPDVSQATADIVAGMTVRDRDDRYRSPLHVVRDIDLALAGRPILGPKNVSLDATPTLPSNGLVAPVEPEAPTAGLRIPPWFLPVAAILLAVIVVGLLAILLLLSALR